MNNEHENEISGHKMKDRGEADRKRRDNRTGRIRMMFLPNNVIRVWHKERKKHWQKKN